MDRHFDGREKVPIDAQLALLFSYSLNAHLESGHVQYGATSLLIYNEPKGAKLVYSLEKRNLCVFGNSSITFFIT